MMRTHYKIFQSIPSPLHFLQHTQVYILPFPYLCTLPWFENESVCFFKQLWINSILEICQSELAFKNMKFLLALFGRGEDFSQVHFTFHGCDSNFSWNSFNRTSCVREEFLKKSSFLVFSDLSLLRRNALKKLPCRV